MEQALLIQMTIFDLENKYYRCSNSLRKYYLWSLIQILKKSLQKGICIMREQKKDLPRKQQINEFLSKILFDYSIRRQFSQIADDIDNFIKMLSEGGS